MNKCPILMAGLVLSGLDHWAARGDCLGDKCEFWCENSQQCALVVLKNHLYNASIVLEEIRDNQKKGG